jgi:hypothetical protein
MGYPNRVTSHVPRQYWIDAAPVRAKEALNVSKASKIGGVSVKQSDVRQLHVTTSIPDDAADIARGKGDLGEITIK